MSTNITAVSGQPIRVGRMLDNNAESVSFDLSSLCAEYTPEEIKLVIKRDGDDMAYYASGWTMSGSTGKWIPTSADLARSTCLVQPILFAAGNIVAHGEVFRCLVGKSIDEETGDIPSAQSLLIEIGRVSDKADTALATAAQASEDASAATAAAQTATDAASTATQTATEAAQIASQAQATATSASQTATSAQTAAQAAQSAAQNASEAASSASHAAAQAQSTATSASSGVSAVSARTYAIESQFVNPNLSVLREIAIDYGSTTGTISRGDSTFADVEAGKTYTVSADVVKALTGPLEGRISSGSSTTGNIFTIPASTAVGRTSVSFDAPASGQLWISASLGSTWKSYEIVLDRLQIEEGSTASEYVPTGLSPLVDGVGRENLSELSATLRKGIGRYSNAIINCAAADGYTVLGDDPASLEAMSAAKKRGFDLVEVAVYHDDGQLYVARADKSKSDVTIEAAVRHCSKIGIGMCLAVGYGSSWNENLCTHLSRILTTHRMPHVYAQAAGTGILGYIREIEPQAEVIVFFSSGFPALSALASSSSYAEIRTLAAMPNALTSICVKTSAGTVDDAYADGCADLGLGLVGGPEETTAALQSHIQYYNLIVGQKRTSDIYTVVT